MDENIELKIIPRLKLIKLKRRLTQKRLAQMAKVPIWVISKWESGKRLPSLKEAALVQKSLEKFEKPELCVLDPSEFSWVRKKLPNIDVILLLAVDSEKIDFAIYPPLNRRRRSIDVELNRKSGKSIRRNGG
jgi:transcriptional regulator with XRE-family HTH domain